MNYSDYKELHKRLVGENRTTGGHTEPAYLEYTQLNWQRIKRWEKQAKLTDQEINWLKEQKASVRWVVLTEPWCGDAAPSLPLMAKIAEIHPSLELEILLRDDNIELMNQFLTGGAQSIPKLIQYSGDTISSWGPRPEGAARMIDDYKIQHGKLDATAREQLQQWYNENKGREIVSELLVLLGRK